MDISPPEQPEKGKTPVALKIAELAALVVVALGGFALLGWVFYCWMNLYENGPPR